MKEYTKHALTVLTARYRRVLKNCLLMNALAAAVVFSGVSSVSATPAEDYWAQTGDKNFNENFSLPGDFWASGSHTLTVNGNASGGAGMINVNYDMYDEGYASQLTGTVVLNGDTSASYGFNIAGGRLKLGVSAANAPIGYLGAYGGTLDLQNGHAGDVLRIQGFEGSLPLMVDFDASTGAMDKVSITQAETTMFNPSAAPDSVQLVSVNVVADGSATSGTYMDRYTWPSNDPGNVPDLEPDGTINDTTTTVTATMTSSGQTYTFTKTADGVVSVSTGGAPVVPPTKTLAQSIADSSLNAFSAVGNVSVDSDLGALTGADRNFTIYGNNHVIDGGNHAGVTVASGQTLTVDKATLSNFTTAITNAGRTNIANSTVNSAISNTGSGIMHITDSILNAAVANTGSNVVINGTVTLNAALNGTVDSTGTLILGSNADLTGANLAMGTIKLTLPATAVDTAIVNASSAADVSLDVDMSKVSREAAEHYVLTATNAGYTLLNVNNNRYAFSNATFSLEDYKADPTAFAFDTNWTGGDLYILRLATSGEAAVEDLVNAGVPLSQTERDAIGALNDEVISSLSGGALQNANRINTLLDALSGSGNTAGMAQVLKEVAPETAPATTQTATSNAGAVMNVVGGRMGGGGSPASTKGHAGGDFTVGESSVWAQGLYNTASLHKTNGFDSDSFGFAAGFETALTDSVKAGVGYAFTNTDIKTARAKTDVDTHTFFAYGEYKPDDFFVNGVLSYGRSDYEEKTRLTGLKSDYKASTFGMQAMSGYAFDWVTPEGGLRYTYVKQDAYTNALGARLARKTSQMLTGVVGAKAEKAYDTDVGTFTPQGRLALTYDFKRDNARRTVSLANGAGYVARGKAMSRFGYEAGAGVSCKLGESADVALNYEGKFKKDYTDHSLLINFKYDF